MKFDLSTLGGIDYVASLTTEPDKTATKIRLAIYHNFKVLAFDEKGELMFKREERLQFLKAQEVMAESIEGLITLSSKGVAFNFIRLKHPICKCEGGL
jgi:hypothetical protein